VRKVTPKTRKVKGPKESKVKTPKEPKVKARKEPKVKTPKEPKAKAPKEIIEEFLKEIIEEVPKEIIEEIIEEVKEVNNYVEEIRPIEEIVEDIPFYHKNQEIEDFINKVQASEPSYPVGEYDYEHPCIMLFEPTNETPFLNKLDRSRAAHQYNETIGNAEDATVEYYFNTIASIEDVINAFDEVVRQENNVNPSFKIVHDY
jgi:hypothetical protein